MDALSTTAQDDSSGANPSSIKSDDSSPQRESGSGSPPPNCAICLGTCKNKSFTDSCLHQFCFACLLTWSKVKAECPLCKQAFRSIIHNVRSNHQYEEYLVVQRQTEELSSRIDIDRVTAATHRFRYRTTLTLPRRETIAIQELLRHYPFMADVFPTPARAPPARRRREPASFRRTVYRHNLWARPLPDFTGRFRDCSPEFYRYNNTQMHRLVPWLNREMHYLLNENAGHISYVMSRLIELLPQHHINSAEFREAMQRYFGERTDHFLHELYCFASTPYDMAGYDRNVQYTTDTRISTMINEVISSSDSDASVDSDIVMVSSSQPAEPPPGPSRAAPVYPLGRIAPPPTGVVPIETISQSDSDDDSSEVMVVGYIKPPQDRTPEIVDLLGSDSDVVVQEPDPPAAAVKLTLKRTRSSANLERAPKRRRRRRRSDGSTTSDATGTTPERDPERGWAPLYLHSSTASEFSTSDDEPRASERRGRRAVAAAAVPSTSTSASTSASASNSASASTSASAPHEARRGATPPPKERNTERRSGRKSHSGKGVKSSSRASERGAAESAPAPAAPAAAPARARSGAGAAPQRAREQPRRRRRSGRENRRLRSVVNVMYNSNRNNDESNSSANYSSTQAGAAAAAPRPAAPGSANSDSESSGLTPPRRSPDSTSDSEDNLPLNLTLQKMNPSAH